MRILLITAMCICGWFTSVSQSNVLVKLGGVVVSEIIDPSSATKIKFNPSIEFRGNNWFVCYSFNRVDLSQSSIIYDEVNSKTIVMTNDYYGDSHNLLVGKSLGYHDFEFKYSGGFGFWGSGRNIFQQYDSEYVRRVNNFDVVTATANVEVVKSIIENLNCYLNLGASVLQPFGWDSRFYTLNTTFGVSYSFEINK